ncbi:MAG: hypothetical protein ACJ8AM_00115 [Gemmatimonadales bacterium]
MLPLGLQSGSLALRACSPPPATTIDLADGPAPVRLHLNPAVSRAEGPIQLSVTSPSADSIVVSSANGLDRYSASGSMLQASLQADFGDSLPLMRYAARHEGRLLNVVKKPVKVEVCRRHACQAYYHELSILLPERNRRSIAITGGWSTNFSQRAIRIPNEGPTRRGAQSASEVNLQAELAMAGLSARLEGSFGSGARAASLDLSREIKRSSGGMGYGLAVHLGSIHADWQPTAGNAALSSGTAYRASIGPAIMLKGLTVSTQIGVYGNGRGVMQELTNFLSFNGGLTDVRIPLTLTLDRMVAFGDQSLAPRGREALERLTLAWEVGSNLALRLRMVNRRGTWSAGHPAGELHADQVDYTLGAQYTVGW